MLNMVSVKCECISKQAVIIDTGVSSYVLKLYQQSIPSRLVLYTALAIICTYNYEVSCYDPLSQIRNTSLTSGSYISESRQDLDLDWMGLSSHK